MRKLLLFLMVSAACTATAQNKWHHLVNEGAPFQQVQEAFQQEWEDKDYERGSGYNLYKRWEYFMESRCMPSGDINISKHYVKALDFGKTKHRNSDKSSADWQPVGYTEWDTQSYNPGNGRVNVAAKDPNAVGRYYAGTPSGGLWRTNDDFQTWEPLTDDFPTLGVGAIVIHPSNSDIIYIGTGDGNGNDTYSNGVLKTDDGGLTWNTTGLSYSLDMENQIHKLIMHPNDPEILFAATNRGLWKTTTAGEVWFEVEFGDIRDVEFKPEDPSVVYCCSNRVFRSENGGEEFDSVSEGMPSGFSVERMSLGVSEDDANYLYALCVNNDGGFLGMYRSTDSGLSFTERATEPNIMGYPISGNSEGGQGWYDLGLAVNPNNAENVFTGGVNVWRSINGGADYILNAHWFLEDFMAFNYVHADIHNIQYLDNELFVCSDGGIFRSTNNGGSFQDVSKGLQINQFYRFGGYDPNPNLLIGGTQDNGSNLLQNGEWTHVLGADGMEAAISPANPSIMYCASQNGGINGSQNGGISFNYAAGDIDGNGGWVTPYVLHPEEEGTILVGYQNVWRSTNYGNNYTQVSDFGGNANLLDMTICQSNPNVVYAINSGQVFKSTDAGVSWELAATGVTIFNLTYIDVNPEDENDIVLTASGFGDGQKVFRSIDGAESWENISYNLPNIPANCAAIDSDDGSIYVGTDLGIYYWNSSYANWQPYNNGLPNVIVSEIEVNNLSDVVTAATYGRGIWRSGQFSGVDEMPTAEFTSDKRIICVGDSIQFTDLSYGHFPEWSWTFSGADNPVSTEQNPIAYYNTEGEFSVSLSVTNDLGETTEAKEVYIIVQQADESFPYSEPFDSGLELSDFSFTSIPVENSVNWTVNQSVGNIDPGSIWIHNGNLDEPYEAEVFSKQFDMSGVETAYLTFWYAYAQKQEANDDRLRFYTSNNCGVSWVQRELFRGVTDLNTAGAPQLAEFVPNDDQWLIFSYPLNSGDLTENWSFKLRFQNDNGNHIYIDDINLGEIDLSVESLENELELRIFPNPAADELHLELTQLIDHDLKIELVNSAGERVKSICPPSSSSLKAKMNLENLAAGLYILKVVKANGEVLKSEKVIVN